MDSVMVTLNQENYKMMKVKVRSVRIPQIGDKFASRHGQKGTCGMTLRQEDMPFTIEGITPDMIINPHCIPSRMTIGHIIEGNMSKLAVVTGRVTEDCTPFEERNLNEKNLEMQEKGYSHHGNEAMFSPFSGQLMGGMPIGIIYYQRLRHLVEDKAYARPRGIVTAVTRQPTHGRAKGGGLRFGEMERDSVISHGMSQMLRERLFKVSDATKIFVCRVCGMMVGSQFSEKIYECKNCIGKGDVKEVEIPYACKQLIQELFGCHISTRFIFPPPNKNSIQL